MKLISYLLPGILCIACAPKNSYILQGKLPADVGLNEVFLLLDDGITKDTMSRSPVREDGTFVLKGEAMGHLLSLDAGRRYGRVYFYPEPGRYSPEEYGKVLYIAAEQEGIQTRLMTALRAIHDNLDTIRVVQEKLYNDNKVDASAKEMLRERNSVLLDKANDLVINMIEEFKGSDVALKIVYDNLHGLSFDFKFLDRAVRAMGEVPESPMRDTIMKIYAGKKAELLTGKAPGFSLPDAQGKIVSLADYKGKYLLVDFWASWCGPCREKIKDLKKEYAQLQEWGVEVVSISCDTSKKQWLKAVEEDQPTWTQLIVDKKINGSDPREDYKVQTIPRLFLVSPEGMIMEVNPRIHEIKARVGR